MSAGVSPALRSIVVEYAFERSDVEVETSDVDLADAALLHRDPSAERSRLATRGFRVGVVRSWWTGQEFGDLVARITLFRMADGLSASLAVADCWSDLHAANVRIVRMRTAMLGVVSEQVDKGAPVWTAMSFVSVDDLVISSFGCADAEDEAVRRCESLIEMQLRRVTPR